MTLCLPTYVVIDASSSMKPHEAVLNATLSRLHYNLATNPRVSEFARVCVIAFSTDVHVVIPMSDMEQVPAMPEVICGGRTEYGKTFDQLRQCIEQDVSNLRTQQFSVLRPTIFFLTDGGPTDAHWQTSFRTLVDRSWPRHPHVIAAVVALLAVVAVTVTHRLMPGRQVERRSAPSGLLPLPQPPARRRSGSTSDAADIGA
jgi:uncharacterized protein YegL